MIKIETPELQKFEGPREITVDNVQYWSHHTQQFAKSQVSKAKKFVEFKCYEYAGDGFFLCNPIKGYNTRTYTIRKNKLTGEFNCNCQKGMEGTNACSHILGLYYAFKTGYFQHISDPSIQMEMSKA